MAYQISKWKGSKHTKHTLGKEKGGRKRKKQEKENQHQ